MEIIRADEIVRHDRIRFDGEDLPYLVDRAWTATDGMVYVDFSSGDQKQFYPGDRFWEHPATGTLFRLNVPTP